MLRELRVTELPGNPEPDTVYILEAIDRGEDYYAERTDRNIPWIAKTEQQLLKTKTVAIGGCGGMGSPAVERWVRAGIGTVKICDKEAYDITNKNRQIPANDQTMGINKAFATARMVRGITTDCRLIVYPQGICEEIVEHFVAGADVIIDEIEFFVNSPRILLHRQARSRGIASFLGNTVGMSANLFKFEPEGMTVEEYMGLSYEEMAVWEQKFAQKELSQEEIREAVLKFINCYVPVIPEYYQGNFKECFARAMKGIAPILATNPPLAVGMLSDRVLLHLLTDSGIDRRDYIVPAPQIPGYAHFDAAKWYLEIKDPADCVRSDSGRWYRPQAEAILREL